MLKRRWAIPVVHVVAWVLYFSIPFLFNSYMNRNMEKNKFPDGPSRQEQFNRTPPSGEMTDSPSHGSKHMGNHQDDKMQQPHEQGFKGRDHIPFPYIHVISNVILVPMFYLNIFFLLPVWFHKKKYWLFGITQIAMGLAGYVIIRAILYFDHPIPPNVIIFNFLFILLGAFCYYLVKENVESERIQKEKENAVLTSELQFLRWQISPHFLFNVLNNMVALARIKSDKLEPMLIGLSTLMRYMTYETDERKVTIEKEVEYLNSYIALQSLRYGSDVTLDINMDVDGVGQYRIEPMLLIPFVENAFKHGTGMIENPFITVNLHIKDQTLFFEVKNKYLGAQKNDAKDATHGIGLANVRRRLNLLYEDNYDLDIFVKDDIYTTFLTIKLK